MRVAITAAYGRVKCSTTVWASGVVMPFLASGGHDVTGLHTHGVDRSRWMFQATACALSGVPSWNFTPGRSEMVITVPPSDTWYPEASLGSMPPVGVSRKRLP